MVQNLFFRRFFLDYPLLKPILAWVIIFLMDSVQNYAGVRVTNLLLKLGILYV